MQEGMHKGKSNDVVGLSISNPTSAGTLVIQPPSSQAHTDSILWARPYGLMGVALGTLIPTTAECLGFVLPYAMRVVGVSTSEAFKQIFLPSMIPAVPMIIFLYVLQRVVEPLSLLSIMPLAGVGVVVYLTGYLSMGASAVERQICRSFAASTMRFAKARLKFS